MKYGLRPLNIQLFAEGEGDTGAPGTSTANVPSAPTQSSLPEGQEKQFSQEEVNRLISERVEREKKKFESTLENRLSEAEKLAKMNAEQKAQYEKEQTEKKLAEREAKITQRELVAQAKENFAAKGLPLELAGCGVYTDAEACQKSLDAVEKAFNVAVEKAVNERMRGTPPKAANGQSKSDSKEDFLSAVQENQAKRN